MKILLVCLRRLGDVLLATPLARTLKATWPEARVDMLVFAGTAGILQGNPDVDRVLALPDRPSRRDSWTLLRHLAGAISGEAVAGGRSFLKDRLGSRLMAPGITVLDDPLRPRGLGSRPFDGEGVAGRRRELVADSVLATWLLDLATAGCAELARIQAEALGRDLPGSGA